MKHHFLGLAANLGAKEIWRHTFVVGTEADRSKLRAYLAERYGGETGREGETGYAGEAGRGDEVRYRSGAKCESEARYGGGAGRGSEAGCGSEVILTKNGRTGLAIALRTLLQPGDGVLVNGFTCYAVYEALEAAGVRPVWADISALDLNFTVDTLRAALKREAALREKVGVKLENEATGERGQGARGGRLLGKSLGERAGVKAIVVQNTFGNPVEMGKIERFAKRNGLIVIEDLAHAAGVRYPDGREAGTVGAATVLSFGKDKAIDTTSGGAVIIRGVVKNTGTGVGIGVESGAENGAGAERAEISERTGTAAVVRTGVAAEPKKRPRVSEVLRARFYPLFGAMTRGLSYLHLSGPFMRMLLKLHWVEKSADNRLDFETKIAKFEAKLALRQLKELPEQGREPLRRFCLVRDRDEVLQKLQAKGYYFGGFWYEKPVSPVRYYDEVNFPEEECPVATEVAREIVNFPSYYEAEELKEAQRIVERYEVKPRLTGREKLRQIRETVVKNAKIGGEIMLEKLAEELVEAEQEEQRREKRRQELCAWERWWRGLGK